MNFTPVLERLRSEPMVWVQIVRARGSVPREAGTGMLVALQEAHGTIGGGHLEYEAMAHARGLLLGQDLPLQRTMALGPSLGQCCGGSVELTFERVGPADAQRLAAALQPDRWPLALFGAGHVGRALVQAVAPLPFALRWIDSRDEVFPLAVPDGVSCEHSDPVQAAVADLAPGSLLLIMSFSHAEDLDVVAAALRRQRTQGDLPFVGLIGSQTKWATFSRRLSQRGFAPHELAHVTCPIGLPGIQDKAPSSIAAAVAAQLLMVREQIAQNSGKP